MVDLLSGLQDVYSKWESRSKDAQILAEVKQPPFSETSVPELTDKAIPTRTTEMGIEAGEGLRGNRYRAVPEGKRLPISYTRSFNNFRNNFVKGMTNHQVELSDSIAQFKTMPTILPDVVNCGTASRLACTKCSPVIRTSLVDKVQTLGLKNILLVHTQNSSNGYLTRKFHYLAFFLKTKATFNYPEVSKYVLNSERVTKAIESAAMQELEDPSEVKTADSKLLLKYRERAKQIMNDMKSNISILLIRITGYVFFKVFSRLLTSIQVHKSQIEMVKKLNKTSIPVIYLPLHRSHLDYLLTTFILYIHEIRAPVVAAGDNLRITVFGPILRGLGAFYIKRKFGPKKGAEENVYRAILHTYMEKCLAEGHSLEFYIEGGRSRSGKACLPKAGLLSVLIDTFKDGIIEDAYIIPMGVNYDKLMDSSLIAEQMGKPKEMESFTVAIKGIWKAFNANYGSVRIDFAQPFSLKEFVRAAESFTNVSPRSLLNDPPSPRATIRRLPSNASLYGIDVIVDERRTLVSNLAEHVLYDAVNATALMSTNLVAFLLINKHRKGVMLKSFVQDFNWIWDEVIGKGRNVGFSGMPFDIVNNAIGLLGDRLIRVQKSEDHEDLAFIEPNLEIPYVLELAYYSNVAISAFLGNSLVATAMFSILGEELELLHSCENDLVISKRKLLESSLDFCYILQYEFILTPPCCKSLESSLEEVIEDFILSEILLPETKEDEDGDHEKIAWANRFSKQFDDSDEDDEFDSSFADSHYKVNMGVECIKKLTFYRSILAPFVEGYWHLGHCLKHLVQNEMEERKFIALVQNYIAEKVKQGTVAYPECIAAETLRNGLNLLGSWKVVESFIRDNIKIVFLSEMYDNEERLADVMALLIRFKK